MPKRYFRLTVQVEFQDLVADQTVCFSEFVGFYPTRAAITAAMHRPEILYLAGIAAQRHAQYADVRYRRTHRDTYQVKLIDANRVNLTYPLEADANAMIEAVSALRQIKDVNYGNV